MLRTVHMSICYDIRFKKMVEHPFNQRNAGSKAWNHFLEWVWEYIESVAGNKDMKIFYCLNSGRSEFISVLKRLNAGSCPTKKSLLPAHVPPLCLPVLARSRKCSLALESWLHHPDQPWNTPHPQIRRYFITFSLSEPAATDHNLPAVTYLLLKFSPLFCFFFCPLCL